MDASPIGVAIDYWVQVHLRAVYAICCGFGHFFDGVAVGFGQLTQLLLHLLVRGRGAIVIVGLLLCRRSGGYHVMLLLVVALWLAQGVASADTVTLLVLRCEMLLLDQRPLRSLVVLVRRVVSQL